MPAAISLLARAQLPSRPGSERDAVRLVVASVADLGLAPDRRDGLEVAVSEVVLNAMEHGNGYDPHLPVTIDVATADDRLRVHTTDRGTGTGYLDGSAAPDLPAKLRGEQPVRGWGLFLVRSFVDEVYESGGEHHHTVTLELRLDGGTAR